MLSVPEGAAMSIPEARPSFLSDDDLKHLILEVLSLNLTVQVHGHQHSQNIRQHLILEVLSLNITVQSHGYKSLDSILF